MVVRRLTHRSERGQLCMLLALFLFLLVLVAQRLRDQLPQEVGDRAPLALGLRIELVVSEGMPSKRRRAYCFGGTRTETTTAG